jgi:hypothetical protein
MLLTAAPADAAFVFDSITGLSVPSGSGPAVFTQNGRFQTGLPSACSPQKTVPAVESGTFNLTGFAEPSRINEPACVTVTYSTAVGACWTNGLFSASYIDGFDVSNIQLHYAGDVGAGPTDATPVSYSMTVPAGSTLDTNFHMRVAAQGCSSFDVQWSSDRPWAVTAPRINGHPFVGETLTASDGQWPGAPAPTLTRQWRRCAIDGSACSDIPGATGTTYAPAPDDVGHSLRIRVTASATGAPTSTADSPPLGVGIQLEALNGQVLDGSEPTQHGRLLQNAVSPVVSNCAAPKTTPPMLDAANTRFFDRYSRTNESEGTMCTIVSLDVPVACAPNQGATLATYAPSFQPGTSVQANYLADSGDRTRVGAPLSYSFNVPAGGAYDVVVSTVAANSTCASYDLRLGTAAPYPTSPAPSVGGTAMEGQTLTAANGGWTGSPAFSYQWRQCFADGSGCSDVPGAIGTTYPLAAADIGHSYRVRVTATEGAGSASKTSAASPPVAAKPPAPFPGIALKRAAVNVKPNGVVNLTLQCPAAATLACVGTDTLKLGKKELGSKAFLIFNGEKGKLKMTLSKANRNLLAKRKKLKATQLVVSRDARRLPVTTRAPLTLKFKKK